MADIEPSTSNEPLITSQTISDKVYQWIKNAIINGELKPGERIIQENLTKHLGVSRMPIRVALQRLRAEKMVVITPSHGAEVFALSKRELEEIYEVRILLESFAARKSCEVITSTEIDKLERINRQILENRSSLQQCMQLDRDFHSLTCSIARSDYIMEILVAAWDKSDPYKSFYYTVPGSIERVCSEHEKIIEIFRSKDKDALEQSIRSHLIDVVDVISRLFSKAE